MCSLAIQILKEGRARLFHQYDLGRWKSDFKNFERLRGRMASRALAQACKNRPGTVPLDSKFSFCLKWLLDRVEDAKPLQVEPSSADTWMLFTDGSSEPGTGFGGVGGVLFDMEGKALRFFGERMHLYTPACRCFIDHCRTKFV